MATSYTKAGAEYIIVVLHSESGETRFSDTERLIDFIDTDITAAKAVDKNRQLKRIFVANGADYKLMVAPAEDVYLPLLVGERKEDYRLDYRLPFSVMAPVLAGDEVGEIEIKLNGKDIGTVPLVATRDIREGSSLPSLLVGLISKFFS